jgi:hypothetical protein
MLRRLLRPIPVHSIAYTVAVLAWIYIGCFWATVLGGGQ